MKLAYFDCFSGVSGDMILGALVDAGLSLESLKRELKKLPLTGYQIKTRTVHRQSLCGKQVEVVLSSTSKKISHRSLSQIFSLIEGSRLDAKVKQKSKKIFKKLGVVEAKVHGEKIEKIHFHEVGALDSIIDIVGAVIGFELLKIDKVYSSPFPLCRGWVESHHGWLPLPAPATLELLKGRLVFPVDEKEELVTPTGAAILATLSESSGHPDNMIVETVGYGAGSRNLPGRPNLLRLLIGHIPAEDEGDEVTVIETNIDDMNPQVYPYLQERLFKEGALDVFFTPVQMKKGRPGTLVTVLSESSRVEVLSAIIFAETTSLGVRTYRAVRHKLVRSIREIKTKYGKVKVKTAGLKGKITQVLPEYEDCRKIARKEGVPLQEVYDEIRNCGKGLLGRKDL